MNNLTNIQIERINNIFKNIYNGYEKEFETLDDKIEAITQYYESYFIPLKYVYLL